MQNFSQMIFYILDVYSTLCRPLEQNVYSLAYIKKKLNRELYTILKNIEIICFIDFNKVDKYKTFLI